MNKVTLIGRLGQDPEIKESKSGKKYAKFSLATDDGWGDNEKTNWHNCVVLNEKLVEGMVEKYLVKGKPVVVEGSIDINVTEDDEGKKTYYNSIKVFTIGFLPRDNTEKSAQTSSDSDDDGDIPF